eukprot:282469-Pleurochrysis_carterae.AAC.2
MYRLDENAVQPEGTGRAYYDHEGAKRQRERWIEEAKEDLAVECNRERYADELFPKPPPTHPDDDEPSGTFSSESDTQSSAVLVPLSQPVASSTKDED